MDQFDAVSRPSHYAEGRKYEPKDVIRDWGLNFNLGSSVKYISRAGRKDDILQDLRKARQFLDFEIEALEKERKENREKVRSDMDAAFSRVFTTYDDTIKATNIKGE